MITLLILLLLCGCTETKQAGDVKPSGFLDDYSILREGEEGEELLVYENPSVNWANYDKILLDPVVYWSKRDPRDEGVPLEDIQRVVNNFFFFIYGELSQDYRMVKKPGPKTLRIQVALTKLRGSSEELDAVQTVIPMSRAVGSLMGYTTGTPGFTGQATLEFKVTDAFTGELLREGVDRRIGQRNLDAKVDSWDDVDDIMRYWAALARYKLCKLRGALSCVEPEE
jgi:hypothetical protein